MKQLFFMILLVVATSCAHTSLDVRSEYVTHERLASVHRDTPDPRKESNEFGQQITMTWYIAKSSFAAGIPQLTLHLRYGNGEEKTETWPLPSQSGKRIFSIFGEDYVKKGGLGSYLATITVNGKAIAESHHKLWVRKLEMTK